jgi:hypothetical protein
MFPHQGLLKWRSDKQFVRLDSHIYYIRFCAIQPHATAGTLPELNMVASGSVGLKPVNCIAGVFLQPVGGAPPSCLFLLEYPQLD